MDSTFSFARAKVGLVAAGLLLIPLALATLSFFGLNPSILQVVVPEHMHSFALLRSMHTAGGSGASFMLKLCQSALGPLAAIPDPKDLEGIHYEFVSPDTPETPDTPDTPDTPHHPVLFIPGFFGTQLETKLTNREKPHWWLPCNLCPSTTSKYEKIWIIQNAAITLLPYIIDCYAETMMLKWKFTSSSDGDGDGNGSPQKMNYQPGIDTRTRHTFQSVMELDPKTPLYTYYVQFLTEAFGYQPDQQMIAQAFDWRAGPETWMQPGQEFDQMKTKIEQAVHRNNGRGIVVMSISAGVPFFALFLNQRVDQAWKDRHIHAFFAVSPVLSGTVLAPMQYLSLQHNSIFPDSIPHYVVETLSRIIRTTSSVSWFFPHPDAFHDKRQAIITTPTREYHAHELDQALLDAGYEEQTKLYHHNRPYYGGTHLVPGVTTYCLSGYGILTPASLRYESHDMSDAPNVSVWDDGDNCVLVESLRQCDAWAEQQEQPVHVHHYWNQSHAGLLYHPMVVDMFMHSVAGDDYEDGTTTGTGSLSSTGDDDITNSVSTGGMAGSKATLN